ARCDSVPDRNGLRRGRGRCGGRDGRQEEQAAKGGKDRRARPEAAQGQSVPPFFCLERFCMVFYDKLLLSAEHQRNPALKHPMRGILFLLLFLCPAMIPSASGSDAIPGKPSRGQAAQSVDASDNVPSGVARAIDMSL